MPPSFASPALLTLSFFFSNDTATTEIYTLSLHDALPIYGPGYSGGSGIGGPLNLAAGKRFSDEFHVYAVEWSADRSEEHTSELQSHSDLVCRLLLEKKKKMCGCVCVVVE